MSPPSYDELLDEFAEVMENGVPVVSVGDSYCVDDYVLLLDEMGYEVELEDLVDDFGFIAQVTINGEDHALWEGGITGVGHRVLKVHKPITMFEKPE